MVSAPLAVGHTTSPSVCCSSGSHFMVAHPSSVTIISELEGKERLMPATLSCSPPDVR